MWIQIVGKKLKNAGFLMGKIRTGRLDNIIGKNHEGKERRARAKQIWMGKPLEMDYKDGIGMGTYKNEYFKRGFGINRYQQI
ncbi:unnamed protein product [Blepharisma stoltei]|uniref:Uncharacterized protein n=1 Tax=Blepharisma stoltei TaxID=1481888 RepID=A0AAU9K034_9CILI|nr:unnamed protein product [Blepharisma stoltei]